MKTDNNDNLQNHFTAYLVHALDNRVVSYLYKLDRQKKQEYVNVDLINTGYTDFDIQYHLYKYEQYADKFQMENGLKLILESLGEKKLVNAFSSLKDRDKGILLARIFGELSFNEIGAIFNMKPKQAEMAYYYIIRKLRKKLGG